MLTKKEEERLVRENYNLAVACTHDYMYMFTRLNGYDFDDVLQIALMGLLDAIRKCHDKYNYMSFSYYAYMNMRHYFVDTVRNENSNKRKSNHTLAFVRDDDNNHSHEENGCNALYGDINAPSLIFKSDDVEDNYTCKEIIEYLLKKKLESKSSAFSAAIDSILLIYDGYSYVEIAQMMHTNPAHIRMQVVRAREKLMEDKTLRAFFER